MLRTHESQLVRRLETGWLRASKPGASGNWRRRFASSRNTATICRSSPQTPRAVDRHVQSAAVRRSLRVTLVRTRVLTRRIRRHRHRRRARRLDRLHAARASTATASSSSSASTFRAFTSANRSFPETYWVLERLNMLRQDEGEPLRQEIQRAVRQRARQAVGAVLLSSTTSRTSARRPGRSCGASSTR